MGGGVLLWAIGLLWVLNRKGIVSTPVFSSAPAVASDDDEPGPRKAQEPADGGSSADDLVIEVAPSEAELERRRVVAEQEAAAAAAAVVPEPPLEDQGPPTYAVWFESERSIGVCKINYEGGSKTANLHVAARLPEGKLSFSYQCGKHSGRGSIDVKPKRVNGVLFCQDAGGVSVKTVRSKDGRCARR